MNQKNWVVISKVFQIYDRSNLKETLEEKNKKEPNDLQFQKKMIAKMKLRIEEENSQKLDQRIRISFCGEIELFIFDTKVKNLYQVYSIESGREEIRIKIDVGNVTLREATYLELLVFLVHKNIHEVKKVPVLSFLKAACLVGEASKCKRKKWMDRKDYIDLITMMMWKQYEWNHLEEYLSIKAYIDVME